MEGRGLAGHKASFAKRLPSSRMTSKRICVGNCANASDAKQTIFILAQNKHSIGQSGVLIAQVFWRASRRVILHTYLTYMLMKDQFIALSLYGAELGVYYQSTL